MNFTKTSAMRKHGLRILSLITLPVLLLQTTGMGFFLAVAPASAAGPGASPTPQANLDQCQNGGVGNPPINPCAWVNGDLNKNNSHFHEAQSTPFRMIMENLTINVPHTLTIGFDITHSSKHAYDYLTNYHRIAEAVQPCDGISPCVAGTGGDIPAPSDPTANASFTALEGAEGNQQMSIWNGSISSVVYLDQGDTTQAQSEAVVQITFTPTNATAVVAWGGHIASRLDWGEGNSAGGISGSPYHMRLHDLDGSGGNQDRSLKAEAVLPPPNGSLQLTKVVDTGSASPDAFSFTINPDPNGVGTVHTTSGTYLFNNLPAGNYTVTESAFTGYHVVSNTCTNVAVVSGQQASCAYHNAHDTGTITFQKIVQGGTAVPGDWTFTVSGVQGSFHSGDSTSLLTGTYTVTESGPSGYTLTAVGGVCSNLNGSGATLTVTTNGGTCSFTNTYDTGSITVNKKVDADGNGTFEGGNTEANALGFRWGLDGNTADRLMGTTAASLPIGTHTVNENSIANYHFVGWYPTNSTDFSCTHPQGTTLPASLNVVKDQNTSITLCNARDTGTVTFQKIVQGGTAQPGDWTFSISGIQGSFHSGDSTTLPTGTYTATENGPAGYTLTALGGICSGINGNSATLTVTTNGGTCSFTNTQDTGSLRLTKVVDSGTASPDAFSFTINPDPNGVGTIHTTNGTYLFNNLPIGDYTITELPFTDYHIVSNTCTNVHVVKGQQASCAYHNARDTAGLTVIKDVDTNGDGISDIFNSPDWTWDLDGGNQNFPTGSTQTVVTGPHQVSEDNKDGYHNLNWSCWDTQNGNSLGSGVGTSLDVTVPLNGATCRFTNSRDTGTITINKHFDDNGDGQIDRVNPLGWTWDIAGGEQDIAGGQTRTLVTGPYTITEDAITDYSPTWLCSDQTSGSGTSIPLNIAANGEHVVCTFTNTRDTGSVLVHKFVDTNGDGTFDGNDTVANGLGFRWGLNADPLDNAMGTTQSGVLTGMNHVWENAVSGYHIVGWYTNERYSCAEPEGTTLPVNLNVSKDHTSVITFCNALNTTSLGLEKTGPETVNAGGIITYTIAWSITGNTDATNAVITDPIPANTTYLSADCGTTTPTCSVGFDGGSKVVTWTLGNRPVGSSGTVTLNVTSASPIANGTVVTNTATFDTDQTEPVTASARTTLLSAATLNVQKTGPDTAAPGATITYTLAWSVGGNSPVTNLLLTDTLPTDLTFVSASNGGIHTGANPGGVVTWTLGNHLPGDFGSVTITVTTNANLSNGATIINPATLDADETSPVNASKTTTIVAAPILTISKTVNLPFANPGDEPTYSVTITNTGNDNAVNLVLTDTLPTGFTFVDGGGTTKTFSLGTLEKGKSVTVTYRVLIDFTVSADTYKNLATAKADNHGPVTAIAPLEVRIPIVAAATEAPALSLEKRINEKTANPGDTLTYVITVSNSGNAAAQDVRITDTLPKNFTYSDTGSSKRVWMIGTLLAGEVRTITYQTVVGDAVKAGKHTNTAIATAQGLGPVTAKASVEVKIPKVLGALTSTGATAADLIIFLSGLTLTFVAGFGLRKLRKLPS